MPLSLHANTRDGNEQPIVDALLKIGATVEKISMKGVPDLLVGYRGANYLLEIKSEKGTLTDDQADFFALWKGQRRIVRNVNEALEAIGAVSRIVGRDCR